MDKSKFEEIFDSKIANELLKIGFERHGRSLYFAGPQHMVSLIRLGGRMSNPGAISHVLCCRHAFLRNTNEALPKSIESDVFRIHLN